MTLSEFRSDGIEPIGIAEDESLNINGFRDFLLQTFQREPKKRSSAKKLLKQKFIADYEPLIGDVYPALMTDDLDYLKVVAEMYDYNDVEKKYSEFTDYNCKHPLSYAAELGNLDMVKVLAEKVGKECLDKSAALVYAAKWYGGGQVIRYLVQECGADVGVTDGDGKSALDWARERGRVGQDILDMLESK